MPELLRGRNKPVVKFPLKWGHEYLLEPLPPLAFPVDSTEGIVNLGGMGNGSPTENGVYGNCVPCSGVHIEMTTAVAANVSGPLPTSTLAITRYNAFDGNQPAPGPGCDMASYFLWCVKQGYLKAFAPLDHTNKSTMQAFIQAGFGIAIGVNLTDNNQTQFQNGQPFDPAGEQPDPEDGHAVVWAYSLTPTGPHKVGTWGVWWSVTDAWIETCLMQNPHGEAFLLVTTEEQLALFEPALLSDVQALGGIGGEPAPAPAPNPGPMPLPPSPLPSNLVEWWNDLKKWKTDVEGYLKTLFS